MRLAIAVAVAVASAEAVAATASIDVVVVAPGGSEGSVAMEVRARILHHARASRRYALAERAVSDESVLIASGCNDLDVACVKAFSERRGVARVIGAEVKGSEIRLTSVEGAVARGGEWRRLPADPSARIEVIDAWVAELFDAFGWVVVRVPGSVAGARVTVGGKACGDRRNATTETQRHRARKHREENCGEDRRAGAGSGGGSGIRFADAGLTATDGPGSLRRRGGDLLPDAVYRCRARPGRTIVTVEAPGRIAFRHELKVQPWVENEVVAKLVDIVGPAASPLLTTRVTRTRRSPALLWTSIGLAAAGVGLAAMGVIRGLAAADAQDKLRAMGESVNIELAAALVSQRDSDLIRRDVFLAVSGVTLAASVVTAVFFARGKREVVLLPTAGGIVVAGTF